MGRKQKKYHYLYKITNMITNKYYYGMHSTDNLDDDYLGSGRRLRYSINKYGKENHRLEILEYCSSREELKNREREVVNLNEIAKEECINLMIGGEGGFISEEQQRRRSIAANKALSEKLKNDIEFHNKFCEKISNGLIKRYKKNNFIKNRKNNHFKNRKHTDESKFKMSESSKGKGIGKENSQYGTCWITNGKINKKINKDSNIPLGWKYGRILKH